MLDLLRRGLGNGGVDHEVQLTIMSDHLDPPIIGDMVGMEDSAYAADALFQYLHRVLQSKTLLPLDESFRIHTLVIDLVAPVVGARCKRPRLEVLPPALLKHAILLPDLGDEFEDTCLLSAITLGLAHIAIRLFSNISPEGSDTR